MKNLNLRDNILSVNSQIAEARQVLAYLLSLCKHEELNINEGGMSAKCNICGKYFLWYCPSSPTLTCDYKQEDGFYDEDDCIYCHQPEERK